MHGQRYSARGAAGLAATLCLLLSAVAPAMAETPARKFGVCVANSPGRMYLTAVFALGPPRPQANYGAVYEIFLQEKYFGGKSQRLDAECSEFASRADAEARRRRWATTRKPHPIGVLSRSTGFRRALPRCRERRRQSNRRRQLRKPTRSLPRRPQHRRRRARRTCRRPRRPPSR